jgi:hypothetical protein
VRVWRYTTHTLASGGSPLAHSASLTLAAPGTFDKLGASVDISNDSTTIVAGAPGVTGTTGLTAVWIQPTTGWAGHMTPVKLLTAAVTQAGAAVGASVAINGDASTIVVGAPWYDLYIADQGVAFVYRRASSGWAGTPSGSVATLAEAAATAGVQDGFGSSVGISSDASRIVAGAPTASDSSGNGALIAEGRVFSFERPAGNWYGLRNATEALYAANEVANARYGQGLDMDDGTSVVIGAPGVSTPVVVGGKVELFTR